MERIHKTIEDLVGENLVFASVLYYFGIKFYDYSERTLAQVCQEKGLDPKVVIKGLESEINLYVEKEESLVAYPIDLIVAYLKHSHYIFIKKRLPFIARLLEHVIVVDNKSQTMLEDLKLVFPLFIEDFIEHIYEEEDTLFDYILNLNKVIKGEYNPSKLYFQMEKHALQNFAMEHELHDDEMQGIRRITKDYKIKDKFELSLKVIISELQALDQELILHANIENKILFPKAMKLENDVKELMADKIRHN
jgi:regulator of cell morphogenesis and NO signaling